MIKPTSIPVVHCQAHVRATVEDVGLTSEYGDDRFMNSLYLFLLQHVTCEQGRYEQHDQNEERP
jgi:hypothetical protein